ncbi:MAG: hypothetical protein HYU48_01525 [Candidatus Levybacteria bacterium]|nr:hypothetical protein [Candidatus Levybacteria bacterium]
MEDQILQENLPPNNYISLVEDTDKPEIEIDSEGEAEHVLYPAKRLTNVGLANLWLFRQTEEEEYLDYPSYGQTIEIGEDSVPRRITHIEAFRKGLYNLLIDLKNPLVRHRSLDALVFLSLDGQKDSFESRLLNETEEDEEVSEFHPPRILAGTKLLATSWHNVQHRQDSTGQQIRSTLYVQNNPTLLSKLKFRFVATDRQEVRN